MKLLTKAEHEFLCGALDSGDPGACDGGREPDDPPPVQAVKDDLFTQGRWGRGSCPCHGVPWGFVTPAGREALKLWPMLVERGLVQP